MKHRGQIVLGAFLALLGVWLLLQRFLHIDLGQFCWPIGLILLGGAVLLRPSMLPAGTAHTVIPFGELKRSGSWQVGPEEIWMLAGDVRLNLTEAGIPEGETVVRVISFVSDLDLDVPQGLAISVSATSVFGDVRCPGRKEDRFLSTTVWASEAYEGGTSGRRLAVEVISFVLDLDVNIVQV